MPGKETETGKFVPQTGSCRSVVPPDGELGLRFPRSGNFPCVWDTARDNFVPLPFGRGAAVGCCGATGPSAESGHMPRKVILTMKHLLQTIAAVAVLSLAAVRVAGAETLDLLPRDSVVVADGAGSRSRGGARQLRRDSIRRRRNVWVSVLGGPSYTPEASFGVGGAMLMSFRIDRDDTLSQRSYLPIGFNASLNGTVVVSGSGALFFSRDRFRVDLKYSYRDEPSNYYGVGYGTIEHTERGPATTEFHKSAFQFSPRLVWRFQRNFYLGASFDVGHTVSDRINPTMAADPYFLKYAPRYTTVGLGPTLQYDSRDDVATPSAGVLLGVSGMFYGRWLGSTYGFGKVDVEYRHFVPLFHRRSVLGWTLHSQMGFGDIPFTELPMFGSPFDLRGYYWGKYRDRTMAYGLVEYRHMFCNEEVRLRGRFLSRLGFAVWGGAGSIGATPADWTRWKTNYGVGLRFEVQPKKNFRLDVGREPGVKGWLFYMNMTEAF